MAPLGKPRDERARLQAEVVAARKRLRDAEEQMRRVQQRGPLVQRIASSLNDRRIDNHLARDFEITLTPRRHHA